MLNQMSGMWGLLNWLLPHMCNLKRQRCPIMSSTILKETVNHQARMLPTLQKRWKDF